MQKMKQYYEKMMDYKRYGIVLLCFSIFFYLGVVIPSAAKNENEIMVMMIGSIVCLLCSFCFFSSSKSYRNKLMETEEGQAYLNQRKNI